ncbi:MAG: c-type cytochrome [Nitrospirae bacterium]|nr:MAG: c-type cytochrome [Nitrospirota bacterium]
MRKLHIRWTFVPVMLAVLLGLSLNVASGDLSAAPAFNPPGMDEIPSGPGGDAIRHGYEIVMDTQRHAKPYLGNALSCRNCHLDGGRNPQAGPFVGVYAVLPEYRARGDRMTTIEIRINECFERSLNGRPLPYDSREMGALVSYLAWMSKGVPAGTQLQGRGFPPVTITRPGDPIKGRALYGAQCSACHGADGLGNAAAPPVWGPQSYNKGAGMARVGIAASFIKRNMPLGQGNTLTDEEAYDLAAFINNQPRPEFPGRTLDWPKVGKPADILY